MAERFHVVAVAARAAHGMVFWLANGTVLARVVTTSIAPVTRAALITPGSTGSLLLGTCVGTGGGTVVTAVSDR